MELKFLGRGAAFNPKGGNNSAYFIEKGQLFLIDCGESVFRKLIEKNIFNGIDTINLIITHTHSDHIGSLGSLVAYSYYKLKIRINIIIKKDAKYISNIKNLLNIFGCSNEAYKFIDEEEYDNKYESFKTIRYIETKHSDNLDCYSIIFNTLNGLVYYSGDTREIDTIKFLIESDNNIDKIYIDTTNEDFIGNPHLYIGILKEQIPDEFKNKVYCMHINNDECIKECIESGFNVVEI